MKYLLTIAVTLLCCSVSVSAAADNYLASLLETITQARPNLEALTKSAETAATNFLSGGRLWAAGGQEDFIAEACGRAGGLVAIAALGRRVPEKHDVILYAVPGPLAPADRELIEQWEARGVTVVTFSSAAGLYRGKFPLDTVANVVELWTWTGEFVAACTRLGKMPVLYQSCGLPGGVERGKKYRGKRLHDDMVIQPITAGVLGREYLRQLQDMLTKIRDDEWPKILKAAKWRREADSATTLVTGHMFPRHVQDPRAPSPGDVAAVPAWDDKELLDTNQAPQSVLYVGYQFAPRKLLLQAKSPGVRLAYFSVQPGEPPEPADNILYIAPAFPLADGCVSVPGYDVPILPASGVVQAALYWSIVSEAGDSSREDESPTPPHR